MSKNLNALTEAQLAELAQDLGLELDTAVMSKTAVVKAIKQAQEEDERAAAPHEVETPTEPAPAKATKPRRYRIIVHEQQGVNDTPFVKVGVNGVMYALPREVEIDISADVKHVLDNAVETHIDQHKDNSGNMVRKERHVRRFAYTLVDTL